MIKISDIIEIWCDGGCKKDGTGGWGVVLKYKEHTKELYGGEQNTTNNQMELTACIKALEAIKTKGVPIVIYSDSTYVVKGINEWVEGWIRNNWIKSSDRKPVLNASLWQRLLLLSDNQKQLKFVWVKGHDGNIGNEKADDLATKGIEEIYEK